MTKMRKSGRLYGNKTARFYGILLSGLMVALCPLHVFALGFLIPNQDAAAIARGNAFAATADNPSAIFYNPAGISQLEGQNIEVGILNYLGIDAHHDSPGGPSADTKFQVIPVPQVYYTFSPTNLPLSFGVGLYAPFGLGVGWPENSGFRSLAIDSQLQYITLNPVVAWKIRPGLSLAVGPTINYSQVKFTRGLASSTDEFEFNGDGFAFGFTAGLLWQPVSQLSFGVSYRSASTMGFSGNSTYNYPGVGNFSASTTANVPFPEIVSSGVSYRPTPKWNIEVDVDWINWSTLNTVAFNGTKNIALLGGQDLVLPFYWHDSLQYKFGVTRYFEGGWFVSAGYFFSSDTTSSTYFNPAVPDTDLHVGSLGFGHNGEHWHWALAGQIIAGPERTIAQDTGNTNPYTSESAAGKYQLFVPTLTASVSYHF
jgi:long-chain fatty acid transport protein